MLRRLAAATTGAALLCTAFAGTASAQDELAPALLQLAEAAPAPALADGYYKKAYSSDVYRVDTADGVQFSELLSYRRWVADGSPTPADLPVRYVSSSFSGQDVFGLSSLPQPESDVELLTSLDLLTYDEYLLAGSPAVELYDAAPVVLFFQYATSPQIFAAPLVTSDLEGVLPVVLSEPEWRELGAPTPDLIPYGFFKLTWQDNIGVKVLEEASDIPAATEILDRDSWTGLGRPAPDVEARFEGDQFFFATAGSPVVTYAGPTYYGTVSYGQWVAAGSPTPTAGPR